MPSTTSSTIKTPSATKYAIFVLFFSMCVIYLLTNWCHHIKLSFSNCQYFSNQRNG